MATPTNRVKRKPVAVRTERDAKLVRLGWQVEDLTATARRSTARIRTLESEARKNRLAKTRRGPRDVATAEAVLQIKRGPDGEPAERVRADDSGGF